MLHSNITNLSDRELLSRINQLTQVERQTTLDILLHLNEVERRKLFLKLGFHSMFDYCMRRLKYSASAAGRRIQTARAIRRFPSVLGGLRRHELNLSTVALVASILTEENHAGLLKEISNKSQKEVEAVVARFRPQVLLRDRMKPICVAVTEGPVITPAEQCVPAKNHSRSGSKTAIKPEVHLGTAVAKQGESNSPKVRIKQRMLIQFSANEAFIKKFNEARSLLSNKHHGGASFEDVFEAALDDFLDRRSPTRRKERREKRLESQVKKDNERKTLVLRMRGEEKKKPLNEARPGGSRRIPVLVRDEVFVRDKGRCTYMAPGGKRCEATNRLTLDHIAPFARGGSNTAGNLRLLCAQHNRLEAERVYGSDFMRKYSRQK